MKEMSSFKSETLNTILRHSLKNDFCRFQGSEVEFQDSNLSNFKIAHRSKFSQFFQSTMQLFFHQHDSLKCAERDWARMKVWMLLAASITALARGIRVNGCSVMQNLMCLDGYKKSTKPAKRYTSVWGVFGEIRSSKFYLWKYFN